MKITQAWPYQNDNRKFILEKYKKQRMVSAFLCTLGITSGSALALSMAMEPAEIGFDEVLLEAVCFTDVTVSGASLMKKSQLIAQLKEDLEPSTFKKIRKR